MGCVSSKQSRCRHCGNPSPYARSYSMPQHKPTQIKDESYHVVALTTSTLGSLKIDSSHQTHHSNSSINDDPTSTDRKSEEFFKEVILAKTWSDMINEKIPKIIPKTPIRTPPGEPETINAWELMEGLEDGSPFRLRNPIDRCFSFHAVPDSFTLDFSKLKTEENGTESPTPLWLQMTDSDPNSIVTDFDPEIISTFRKAIEEFSPATKKDGDITASGCPPRGENRVVIYFTSLRGVRKTYEDSCHVRVILKGLGVRVDERDVSMHSGFKEELKELFGDGFNGGLPRVFVKGRYIGGAEEVRQLHEDGDLEKVLEGCEVVDEGGGGGGGACEGCGDIRFVPCERCSGSCKIYFDGNEDEEEGEGEYGFQRCPDCNENGIVRCPVCCC